jgi:hypothetical protein
LDNWEFLVCTANYLNEKFGNQKSVGLNILKNSGLVPIAYDKLASAVLSIKTQ